MESVSLGTETLRFPNPRTWRGGNKWQIMCWTLLGLLTCAQMGVPHHLAALYSQSNSHVRRAARSHKVTQLLSGGDSAQTPLSPVGCYLHIHLGIHSHGYTISLERYLQGRCIESLKPSKLGSRVPLNQSQKGSNSFKQKLDFGCTCTLHIMKTRKLACTWGEVAGLQWMEAAGVVRKPEHEHQLCSSLDVQPQGRLLTSLSLHFPHHLSYQQLLGSRESKRDKGCFKSYNGIKCY